MGDLLQSGPTSGDARRGNYYGHSRIVAQNGKILADTGYAEGLAVATVDIDAGIEHARTREFFGLNLLQDRRPAVYRLQGNQGICVQPDSVAQGGDDDGAELAVDPAYLALHGSRGTPGDV